jgi:hypothetical protein
MELFSWFVNLLDNKGNVKICEGMCPSYRKNGIIPLSHPPLLMYTYRICNAQKKITLCKNNEIFVLVGFYVA